jgi:hypothetical protein
LRPSPATASVVIPSYNYARFLRDAVGSALRQSRPPCEVIVVDDGSCDESPSVIESFGGAVRAVLKRNGGQASAINAGCALARGDVVFLLDSDDELRPDAIETVLEAWRPDTVMVQWRLSQMDAAGRDVVGSVPAPWIRLDEGDVRARLLSTGGFGTTVTSGLAFRRDALMKVMPIPEARFRQGADGYLVRAVGFLGPVQAIERPLTRYRRHGENELDLGASRARVATGLRKRIDLASHEIAIVPELASQHGLAAAPNLERRNAALLYARLGLGKVEPERGGSRRGASVGSLLPRLVLALLRSNRTTLSRFAAAAFALALALSPGALAWRLLAWRHTPAARPRWLAALASWWHRAGPAPEASAQGTRGRVLEFESVETGRFRGYG